MSRWPVLADFLGFELLEVAKEMASGDYWREPPPWQNEIGGGGSEPDLSSWEG